jgi:hypothetical protein
VDEMSWTKEKEGTAITKGSILEMAKQEVSKRLALLEERHRTFTCSLIYGEPKTGKSGIAMDCRTEEEIENGCEVRILDFDNGCEPTWRKNWDADPTIKILNPIVRDDEGYPDLDQTILLSEAFIAMIQEDLNNGVNIKFVFDGVDRWNSLCFLTMTEDKRSTNTKFLPVLWGKRNKIHDDLMDKAVALTCDRFFITHMKDVYEGGISNPNPTGRTYDVGKSVPRHMNQMIEVYKEVIGLKHAHIMRLEASRTGPELVGKTWKFLTIENGKVVWESISELQEGEL